MYIFFFSIWFFFHNHSRTTGMQGKRESISLTTHYHFHPLHRHLDISQAITAESSPLHIASRQTQTFGLLSNPFLVVLLTFSQILSYIFSNSSSFIKKYIYSVSSKFYLYPLILGSLIHIKTTFSLSSYQIKYLKPFLPKVTLLGILLMSTSYIEIEL